jgi:tetratricopeptide (TPR) repeat protein
VSRIHSSIVALRAAGLVALTVVPACTAGRTDAAHPASRTASAQPASGKAARPEPPLPSADDVAPAPYAPRLALRAFALASRGQAPAARKLLASELLGLAQQPLSTDDMARADALVAAQQWRHLAEERERWRDTHQVLVRARPLACPDPELGAALAMLQADCAIDLGLADEARSITRALGCVTDWRILGPFDNERGKGFGVKQAPEEKGAETFDFAATYKGKARDVAWRANPAPEDPLGLVQLGEMLRPSSQGLAYLATAVRSDAARECAIHLASNGPLKVFVNGQEVLARKVVRPFADDQDAVAVALAPGWNRVVVKSCIEEEDQWTVSVRFTELDGRPLVLDVDSARAADAPPAAVKARAKRASTAREVLDQHAKDEPDAARLLALYHLLVHPDDRAQKSARKAIEKAAGKDGTDADTLYLQALAFAPDAGTSRAELEVNPWIAPLKKVIAQDPKHVAARTDLARFALDINPTLERADALSAEALRAAPDDADAMRTRATVLRALERTGEAAVLEARIAESDEAAWTDAEVEARASALHRRGDVDAALETLRRGFAIGRHHGPTWDTLSGILLDRGDADGLLQATEDILRGDPFSVATMYNSARSCELLGRYDAARDLQERALRIAPEDTDVLLVLARLDERAGNAAASDARLAEILRIDPKQDKIRRRREFAAAKLSARPAAERFEAPYVWDAREVVARAAAPAGEDEPLCVLDRTCVWSVNRDGTSSSYEHILWRVQNPGGAKSLDRYAIFHSGDSTLSVRNARILHADGRVEAAPAPRGGDQETSRGTVRVYDLPPLTVGDVVDVEYRVDESSPSVFGNYFGLRHEFYPDWPDPLAPTLRSELVFVSDADVKLHFHPHNAERLEESASTDDQGRSVRRWVARDLARPKPELAMPARTELAPRVDVTTYENWQAFATWWWSFIEKEFVTSPEMKAKVTELTAGKTDEMDKIRALVTFVGQEIRYNSWPFGTHGYEPFSAPVIFERRFGDCKDKSILLCQMLSEIGVAAHPVLIKADYARPDEPLDAALVEHFNHCIAYVTPTAARPGMYLDCTADLDPIEYLRADDQGARVLHVDHGQAEIADIPYAPPAENQLVRKYDVTIDEQGNGTVQMVDESNGEFGVGMRTAYGGEKGDIKKRLARDLRGAFAEVDVRDVKTSTLEDIGEPARVETQFGAKKLWTTESGGASLRVAFDPLGLEGLAAKPREERTQDLVLDRPYAHDVTIVYRLPKTVKVATVPPRVELSAPGLLSYVQEVRAEEGTVAVHRRFQIDVRRIPVAQYAAFQDAMRQIEQAEQRTVRLATVPTDAGGR